MPYPETLIRSIAERHGLSGEVSLLPDGGMVNEAWAIGEGAMLRIVKEGKDAECDTESQREAAVVPLLVEAGVTTPRLIAHDSGFAPRPYTVYELVKGEVIGFSKLAYGDYEKAWRQVGRDLFALHQIPVDDCLRSSLHEDKEPDVEKWVAQTIEKGAISQKDANDVLSTAERLQKIGGAGDPRCMIHNDIHPWNLMGDPVSGELRAILDWGDATYGDPARDFAMMPLPCVPAMFEGYAAAGGEASEAMVARALIVGLNVALWESRTPEMCTFERKWWRMPEGGWGEMRSQIEAHFPSLG